MTSTTNILVFSHGECPTPDELAAFAQGQLLEPEIQAVFEHLESCSECAAQIQTLTYPNDTMLAALRRTPPVRPQPSQIGVQRLEAAAKRLRLRHENDLVDITHEVAPPSRIGRYAVRRMLGVGGFGTVWLAWDEQLEREVAVKLPHAHRVATHRDLDRFLKEARTVAQLDHPNIVPIYDSGRTEEASVFAVSKFIDGITLSDRLSQSSLQPSEAAVLIAAVADALHYAHERGIVHRDVKPSNIMLDASGAPLLMDFGIAKHTAVDATVTIDGRIIGTPAYMSPEQARGEPQNTDRGSDIYSLGVVFYELLTDQRPFKKSYELLLQQIVNDEPQSPRSLVGGKKTIPKDLETICLKAMRKESDQRYASAQEMADDLRRYLRGEPIQARPVSRVERCWRWCWRNPVAAASVSLALLALMSLGALLVSSERSAMPLPLAEIAKVIPEQLTKVRLATAPLGATIVFHPLDQKTGWPQPQQSIRAKDVSPVTLELPPGDYLVVAVSAEGASFHEVYRRVPGPDTPGSAYRHLRWRTGADGVAELPEIEIPPASVSEGMARIEGNPRFVVGTAERKELPPHSRSIPSFLLDPVEVSVAKFRTVPPQSQVFSIYEENKIEAVDDEAIAFVNWNDAVSRAETLGKRLPDEFEYEFAATLGGTRKFPWGDDATQIVDWRIGKVGQPEWDRLPTTPPVYGLFSNVAEWTSSWPTIYPGFRNETLQLIDNSATDRIIRGTVSSVLLDKPNPVELRAANPRSRLAVPINTWTRNIGFRCARSVKPRLKPEDFSREVL